MSLKEISRYNRITNRITARAVAADLAGRPVLDGVLRTDDEDIEQDEQDFNIPAWVESPEGETLCTLTITFHGSDG